MRQHQHGSILTEYVSHGVHQVLRGCGGGAALIGQHHGRLHRVRQRQHASESLHAGRDALRHRAAHYLIVTSCTHTNLY